MKTALLITHPKTKLDEDGRVHGALDPPLSHEGEQHARRIARQLRGKKITMIHSSPRQRARQTAEHISKATGAPILVHSGLIPWDLGSLSGVKSKSFGQLLEFFSSRPDKKLPGGESKNDVLKRYARFMKTLKPGEAIVGHSQHSLALDHVKKGGDATKVPMFGGKAGEIMEIQL